MLEILKHSLDLLLVNIKISLLVDSLEETLYIYRKVLLDFHFSRSCGVENIGQNYRNFAHTPLFEYQTAI